MCRHLGYLGPPVSLADLLLNHPHSLERQSWAPRDMRGGGTINVDGFGIGWYAPDQPEPARYRRAVPIWADADLPGMARVITSGAVLAAVRSGTVGMPVVETACAPFAAGPWLFSHNGVVAGWPDSLAELAATLPVTELLSLDAPTDSALLWALVRQRLRQGASPGQALAGVVEQVAGRAPNSRLNLMLTDGRVLAATTWTHALSVLRTPEAVVVASEPWDDDSGWQAVPEGHLLVAGAGPGKSTVDTVPIGIDHTQQRTG